MIYSYDKVYLRIAQRVLGEMLNYAVYDCGYELNEYYRLFTESSYSERFSKGDPFVIAGMSGAEQGRKLSEVVTEKSQTQSEPACGGNRDSRQDDSAV